MHKNWENKLKTSNYEMWSSLRKLLRPPNVFNLCK